MIEVTGEDYGGLLVIKLKMRAIDSMVYHNPQRLYGKIGEALESIKHQLNELGVWYLIVRHTDYLTGEDSWEVTFARPKHWPEKLEDNETGILFKPKHPLTEGGN